MNISTTYTDIRKNLKSSFDKVNQEHIPLLVTRKNGGNVVILAQNDFESLEETAYLLRSPKNAKRLIEAMKRNTGISLKKLKNEFRI